MKMFAKMITSEV